LKNRLRDGLQNALIIDNDADLRRSDPAPLQAFGFATKCPRSHASSCSTNLRQFVERFTAACAISIGDPALPASSWSLDRRRRAKKILGMIEQGKRERSSLQGKAPAEVTRSADGFTV